MSSSSHSRRDFLRRAGTLVAVACAPTVRVAPRAGHDLLIRGGTIYDGSGNAPFVGDIAIDADRITAIAPRITARAKDVIEARDLAVAPGFIDIHSHADSTMFDDPRSESVLRQGVTTVIVGADGSSRAPGRAPEPDSGTRMRRAYDLERSFESVTEFLGAIGRLPPSVNVATMVGLGTVRLLVVGAANRPATANEISRMRALVAGALSQGACGASTGLEYVPGAFATPAELAAVCRPLAERRLPYATHMRNEDDRLLDSLDESIGIARGAGCPLQVSHLKTQGPRNWPKIGEALGKLETARAQGLDVAFDRYPYVAYATGLNSLFPPWSRAGGTRALLARARNSETAERIRRETLDKIELIGGWNSVMITSMPRGTDQSVPGRRVGDLATERGADPYELTLSLVEASGGAADMVGFAMSEENIDRFLAHPLGMVCSDGGAFAIDGPTRRGNPHPRGAGSFPRVLGRYVRERRALDLPAAVYKMSGFPAARVRLAGRGLLAAGWAADVVVFDPMTVADKATFEAPFQYPEGIRVVIVNGAIALREGIRSEQRAGRSLRPS